MIIVFVIYFYFYFLYLLRYTCNKIFSIQSQGWNISEQCEMVEWSWWKERSPVTSPAIKEMTHLVVASLFLTWCYITIIDQPDISRALVRMVESIQSSGSFILSSTSNLWFQHKGYFFPFFFSWNNRVHILSCQRERRNTAANKYNAV